MWREPRTAYPSFVHNQVMLSQTKILIWRFIGLTALLLGMVGLFLPVVPTVPFILLAAWAGNKGWPDLEEYLLSHKHFGPPIRNWRESGAISRSAKSIATIMLCGSLTMIWLFPFHRGMQVSLTIIIVCVVIWMWTRPDAE